MRAGWRKISKRTVRPRLLTCAVDHGNLQCYVATGGTVPKLEPGVRVSLSRASPGAWRPASPRRRGQCWRSVVSFPFGTAERRPRLPKYRRNVLRQTARSRDLRVWSGAGRSCNTRRGVTRRWDGRCFRCEKWELSSTWDCHTDRRGTKNMYANARGSGPGTAALQNRSPG